MKGSIPDAHQKCLLIPLLILILVLIIFFSLKPLFPYIFWGLKTYSDSNPFFWPCTRFPHGKKDRCPQ